MKIGIICNSINEDLYKISRSFYNDLNYDKIVISGENGFYGYKFLNEIFTNKKYDYDWIVLIDEDCFITDLNAFENLLQYQIKNEIHCSGMPDGGIIPLREFNPISINPYFCIIDLKSIRLKYNQSEVKKLVYSDNLDKFIPNHLIKSNIFSEKISEINVKCDAYNFEPYYKIFFWLLLNDFKIEYLDANLWDAENDKYTKIGRAHV